MFNKKISYILTVALSVMAITGCAGNADVSGSTGAQTGQTAAQESGQQVEQEEDQAASQQTGAQTNQESDQATSQTSVNESVLGAVDFDHELDSYEPKSDHYSFYFTYKTVHPWWDAVALGMEDAQRQFLEEGVTITYEYMAPEAASAYKL